MPQQSAQRASRRYRASLILLKLRGVSAAPNGALLSFRAAQLGGGALRPRTSPGHRWRHPTETHKPNDAVPFDLRAEYAPGLPTARNAEEGAPVLRANLGNPLAV